jgi:hypothetical protein
LIQPRIDRDALGLRVGVAPSSTPTLEARTKGAGSNDPPGPAVFVTKRIGISVSNL